MDARTLISISPTKLAFALLLCCALSLRLLLVFTLPFDRTTSPLLQAQNDEPSHYNYVRYLAENRAFPVQTTTPHDEGAFETDRFEYYQPPLYYTLSAILWSGLGDPAGLYAARLLSFLCGIGTLVLVGALLRRLDHPPALQLAGVTFTAMSIVHSYFSSIVSNDSLSWFLSLLITFELMVLHTHSSAHGRPSRAGSLRLCAWLTGGMLTKSSLLIFYPVAAGTFLLAFVRGRDRSVLVHGALVIAVSLILAAPWYARSLEVYGSIFAMQMGFGTPSVHLSSFGDVADLAASSVRYFWFPLLDLPSSRAIFATYLTSAAFVTIHGLFFVAVTCRRKGLDSTETLLLAILALNLIAYLKLNYTWSEPEGRFLFPSLGAIAYLFVIPAHRFLESIGRPRLFGPIVILTASHPYLYAVSMWLQ